MDEKKTVWCNEQTGYPDGLRELVAGFALEILSKGRPGFDVPHTLAVVHWANELTRIHSLDRLVLITAAYLHDIGYFGRFDDLEVADRAQVLDRKAAHMIAGAKMAGDFLNSDGVRDYFSEEQRARIVHLVSVHDNLEKLTDLDELVLMEADTLGAIDTEKVQPTFKGREALNYLDVTVAKRRSRFVTSEAMQAFDQLAERYRNFIQVRDGVVA